MTYFYLALLSYGVTFAGGFLVIYVDGRQDWKDYFIYGAVNSATFGTALYVTLILLMHNY